MGDTKNAAMRVATLLLLVSACGAEGTREAAHGEAAPQPSKEAAKAAGPTTVAVPDGPITSQTLLLFLPDELGGFRAESRAVADEALAAGAYRTPDGYINVNLALTREVAFDRAQVEGAQSDDVVRNEGAGLEKRGVAVGSHRGLFTEYLSGSKVELAIFLGDRINVSVSREGKHEPAALVTLARQLDLDGLAALAPRARAPAPP